MNVFIYTLRCPVTFKIRYVGKTRSPDIRLRNHQNKKSDFPKRRVTNWVRFLQSRGFSPIMEILDCVSEQDGKSWESYFIQVFESAGMDLMNSKPGKRGLSGQEMVRLANSLSYGIEYE